MNHRDSIMSSSTNSQVQATEHNTSTPSSSTLVATSDRPQFSKEACLEALDYIRNLFKAVDKSCVKLGEFQLQDEYVDDCERAWCNASVLSPKERGWYFREYDEVYPMVAPEFSESRKILQRFGLGYSTRLNSRYMIYLVLKKLEQSLGGKDALWEILYDTGPLNPMLVDSEEMIKQQDKQLWELLQEV